MAKSKRTAKMEKEYWEAQNKASELRAENETLRLANENLRCILEENGIRPHQLLVTYYDVDCYNCDCYSGDEDDQEWEECYYRRCDEECPKKKKMEKVSFYTYSVDADVLTGIITTFQKEKYIDVISVVDAQSGKTLFSNEKYETEFKAMLKDFAEKYKIPELIEQSKELLK